jgi:hypothetical protein
VAQAISHRSVHGSDVDEISGPFAVHKSLWLVVALRSFPSVTGTSTALSCDARETPRIVVSGER